jgi:alpha-tubulin suppressor-like RCC1 family protein
MWFSIALLNDNTVDCWGNNTFGQCNPPDSIQGRVVSISCGNNFSCALLNNNTIKCWGDD